MTKHVSFLDRLIDRLSAFCVRFPWTLFLISLLLCTGTAYYVYNHLSVNTNTAEMLSPDLPFQKNQRRIDNAFPQDAYTTLFVINGQTPEQTSQAANALKDLIEQRKREFESVYIPTDNVFFRQQALLYLDTPDLQAVAKKLTDAQPCIGHLAQNSSLGGLFELIHLALNEKNQTLPMDLKPLINALDNHFNEALNGKSQALSWQNLLADMQINHDANRAVVIAKPKLHFDEMLPADAAQAAARNAAEIVMKHNPAAKISITGEVALEHEELESVSTGAEVAGIASLILVFLVQWIGFHSFRLLIITYIVLIMGLVFTAGFAAITVGHLT